MSRQRKYFAPFKPAIVVDSLEPKHTWSTQVVVLAFELGYKACEAGKSLTEGLHGLREIFENAIKKA